jgi:hypothetical protein
MIAIPAQLHKGFQPVVVDCVCCGRRLSERDEFCGDCQTPATLSQTVAMRGGANQFVSVLGASNAGKTVYLGLLLDILSKGPEDFRGMASSAFSVELQEQVINALEHRRFPEKTPAEVDAWKWLHCQISIANKKDSVEVDLISPDFAGEAIAMEINQYGLYPAIQHIVAKSSGILILCDSLRVRDEGSGEDLFAMKLASYIAHLHGLSSDGKKVKKGIQGPSVAVVFTKCDGCPEATYDPTQFAANNTPRLFEFCRRTFSRHAFFAASVAGNSGMLVDNTGLQMRIPFHIEPRGIVQPLQWVVGHRC